MQLIQFSDSIRQWNYWYKVAILNSFFFWMFTLLNWGLFADNLFFSITVSGFYFLLSSYIFLKMVMSGGSLAPISWFIMGSGLFFGAGTVIWGTQFCTNLACTMTGGGLEEKISSVNMLNAFSGLMVVIAASKLSFQNTKRRLSKNGLDTWDWVWIHKVSIPFVVVATVLNFYYFPVPESFMVRTVLSKLNYIVPLFMFLTGVNWRKLSGPRRIISLTLIVSVLTIGFLSFSKTAFVVPLLVLLSGVWVARQSLLSIVIPGVVLVLFYIVILVPSVSNGRLDIRYDDTYNSLLDRVEILTTQNQSVYSFEEDRINRVSGRFSHGFIQIYLIEQYDAGKPGESLKDFWVALIPRVLWPGKPNVTRFGGELYNQFRQTRNVRSALAPTFSAEAYWNFGNLGVLVISILIGLELGWLTNVWFRSIHGGDTAYLIVAFPAAYMGFNVEAWIAASYVGGFITLIFLWQGLKLFLSQSRQNRPSSLTRLS